MARQLVQPPPAQQARLKIQQGVRYLALEQQLDVMDPRNIDAGAARSDHGEVMFSPGGVMKFTAIRKYAGSVCGGWFHSRRPRRDAPRRLSAQDGRDIVSLAVSPRSRSKGALSSPDVAVVAVVAMPHDRWGETPCAFVELCADAEPSAVRSWVRCNWPGYKVPGYRTALRYRAPGGEPIRFAR
jgi:fatty-acyl-CoA synthase